MKKIKISKKNLFIISTLFLLVTFIVIFFIKKTPSKKNPSAKIAIVIDDWGYTNKNLDFLKEIDVPFDVAILPNLPFSKEIAQTAKQNKKEVILHLPLEPSNEDKMRLEADTITTIMTPDKIKQILILDIKSVPYAKGVSNHMGSKATSDKNLMKIIFRELKKKKMFFLDSYVTDKSIVNELSKKIGIPVAKRAVFLDNIADTDYIIKQLVMLANKAKLNGYAIGIGHERSLTLKILKDYLPKLKKMGFEFVFVSKLIQ